MGPDGRFAVVWETVDADGQGIATRRLSSSGAFWGEELAFNELTTGDQEDPSVTRGSDEQFVVVWASDTSAGSDIDGPSIQARIFVEAIFADGFESADVTAWSQTVP